MICMRVVADMQTGYSWHFGYCLGIASLFLQTANDP